MSLSTAVVLAGGEGLRLRPITNDIPKPMVPVLGKPLLHRIVDWLALNGIRRVIIGVAHKKEAIIDYFAKNRPDGVEIVFSKHGVDDGTGKAFRLAITNGKVSDEVFLAMNGDELTDLSLRNLLNFHKEHDTIATIVSAPLKCPFGVVETDGGSTVTAFREKPVIDTILINMGVYLFTQKIVPYLPEQGDIERDTFVRLAREGNLKTFRYYGFWRTVNTLKDLQSLEAELGRFER